MLMFLTFFAPYIAAIFEAPIWSPALWGLLISPLMRRSGIYAARSLNREEGLATMLSTPNWIVVTWSIIFAYIGYAAGLTFEWGFNALFH